MRRARYRHSGKCVGVRRSVWLLLGLLDLVVEQGLGVHVVEHGPGEGHREDLLQGRGVVPPLLGLLKLVALFLSSC